MGDYLQEKLQSFVDHPLVGEVSGKGMIGALELVANKDTKQAFEGTAVGAYCAKAAEAAGLIVRPLGGNRVALCPPLILQREHVDELIDKLTIAVNATLDFAKQEQLLANRDPKALKVLHIEAGRFLYGGAQQVAWLTHGLAQRGVQNVLVCPEDGDIQNAVAESTVIHAIPMRGDLDLGWFRLAKLLRAESRSCTYTAARRRYFRWSCREATGVPCVLSRRVDNREPRWFAPQKYRLYQRVVVISEAIGGFGKLWCQFKCDHCSAERRRRCEL